MKIRYHFSGIPMRNLLVWLEGLGVDLPRYRGCPSLQVEIRRGVETFTLEEALRLYHKTTIIQALREALTKVKET